ncbi:hypothetical protein [Robertmurraya sp. FSL R5-0851]|uniref:hypothetical protein n=1 Tax=Robertmurraya sp. FSL R5-0851 TaxID=2921584 RepID=UPI0030FC563E
MERIAIQELSAYWKKQYLQQKDLSSFQAEDNDFKEISIRTREKFNLNYFPQPFYGYFEEDMKNDVLVPLINPGSLNASDVLKQFPSDSEIESRKQWNLNIVERHCTNIWTKEVFHQKEREYDRVFGGKNKHWRGRKLIEVRQLLGEDIGFLHTIEFFPFHSDSWKVSKKDRETLYNLPSTIHAIRVLEEIASTRAVRHILGIGLPWIDILSHYSNLFVLEDCKTLKGPKGKVGQRFYKFKPVRNSEGLPLVIYSTSSMNLPTNQEGVDIILEFLEHNRIFV